MIFPKKVAIATAYGHAVHTWNPGVQEVDAELYAMPYVAKALESYGVKVYNPPVAAAYVATEKDVEFLASRGYHYTGDTVAAANAFINNMNPQDRASYEADFAAAQAGPTPAELLK